MYVHSHLYKKLMLNFDILVLTLQHRAFYPTTVARDVGINRRPVLPTTSHSITDNPSGKPVGPVDHQHQRPTRISSTTIFIFLPSGTQLFVDNFDVKLAVLLCTIVMWVWRNGHLHLYWTYVFLKLHFHYHFR